MPKLIDRTRHEFTPCVVTQCLVRVSRFGTELGFVLMPSMLWLQLFFVVSLPSILINTIRTLNSCGIEFDELKELLVSHKCSPILWADFDAVSPVCQLD